MRIYKLFAALLLLLPPKLTVGKRLLTPPPRRGNSGNDICLMLVAGVILMLAGCTTISPAEIQQLSRDVLLIDVREPAEFASGHIPGAINVPLDILPDEISRLVPDLTQEIVVYCRSGARSRSAMRFLEEMGYTNITDLGGILDWPGEIVVQ